MLESGNTLDISDYLNVVYAIPEMSLTPTVYPIGQTKVFSDYLAKCKTKVYLILTSQGTYISPHDKVYDLWSGTLSPLTWQHLCHLERFHLSPSMAPDLHQSHYKGNGDDVTLQCKDNVFTLSK